MKNEHRSYNKVFEMELKGISKRIDNILEYNVRQDKIISRIDKIITGNGEPEKGVITRLIVGENNVKTLFKKFKDFNKFHYAIGVTVIIAMIKIAFF